MNWLTVKEAAERRPGVTATEIYLWCRERRLRHRRSGKIGCRGKITVTLADLDAFIESQVVEPVTEAKPKKPRSLGAYRHLNPAHIGIDAPTSFADVSR